MAANVNIIAQTRIVHSGGDISSDRYTDDGSNDLVKGELCYISNGTVVPVSTAAEALSTASAPFDAAAQYAICLEDRTADGTSIAVQRVDEDTVFEGYLVDSSANGDVVAPVADIGDTIGGYHAATGLWAPNNVAANGLFVVVDVMDNYDPWTIPDSEDYEEDSGGVRHDRVQFRFLASLIQ